MVVSEHLHLLAGADRVLRGQCGLQSSCQASPGLKGLCLEAEAIRVAHVENTSLCRASKNETLFLKLHQGFAYPQAMISRLKLSVATFAAPRSWLAVTSMETTIIVMQALQAS